MGNAIPGLIRFDNAPYQREPLDMVARPECHRITMMWGAQTGKTQVVNCALGFNIAQIPQSQIMMQPSQGDLQTWLETKFKPMVDSNEVLSERIAKPRSHDGVNNQRMISYPGGFLMFSWSGSPKTMRGRSAPKVYCDEVDGYEVTAEGHPVSLLWQRAATFGDQRLLFETSTPTIKGASQIEKSFEAGDQRRFFVPCPHCDEFQALKWSQVQWDKDDKGEHMPETAYYACEHCGGIITDGHKLAMLRRGEWRAAKPFRGHASYHLSELYSGFRRWRDIVQSFLEKKAQGDLQTFVNVSLAETWEEDGEALDDGLLHRRREHYARSVPDGVLVLTAAVDVQDDRLEIGVEGWGLNEENWKIDYHVLHGDPSRPEIWARLAERIESTYEGPSGPMRIHCVTIDSGGHHTQMVYRFVKPREGARIFAIKGSNSASAEPVSRPRKSNLGKVNLFTIGVSKIKDIVVSRLKIADPGSGYVHFPVSEKFDQEYFAQLTGEKRVIRFNQGHPRIEWVKTRPRQEAFDIAVYNYAAFMILNPAMNRIAAKRKEQAEAEDQPTPEPEQQQQQQAENTERARPVQRQRRPGKSRGFGSLWR